MEWNILKIAASIVNRLTLITDFCLIFSINKVNQLNVILKKKIK